MSHPPSLSHFLRPRSVAVIGASDNALRIGGRPIAYMRQQGFAGKLLPVNPNRANIQGLPAYASVSDLPETPDLAIVAVAAKLVPQVIQDLGARGTPAAIVFSAGFAETGVDGAALERQMLDAARVGGLRLLGPNFLGVINPRIGFYGSFTSVLEGGFPVAGRVGIVSQSGAYSSHILGLARDHGIGVSSLAMSGNESDVTLDELIQALVDDPDTDVIAVYAEGLRNGSGLLAALEAARQARKPVVMMKVGVSVVGSMAAQSHTASLAGNDAVTDAALAEVGVVRARSTDHLLDVARLATRRIYPVGNSLGVITVSGGAGVIIADAAEALGLPMPEMPAEAQRQLKTLIPFSAPRNPVDCTAQYMNDLNIAVRFTETMIEAGGYPSILGFFTYTANADSIADRLREQLKAIRDKHPDRLFALCIMASPARVQEYERDGFAVFEDPARAVAAIHAMGRFGDAFARAPRGSVSQPAPELAPIRLSAHTPSEAEAKRILAQAGIASVPERIGTTADEAEAAAQSLGYPVVMKILSPDILHKSEIGGVLLDLRDAESVRAGFDTLIDRARHAVPHARLDGVLVARQLSGGVECILGIQRDPVFGPIALFGLGGIFVEILHDVVLRRCPFDTNEAHDMIRSIQGAPLLLGARGRPPVDVHALAIMLSRLSIFAHQAGERLTSIDLNPVFALPQGQGAYAADAVITLRDAADRR